MIENNPTNVRAAFEMLLDEIKAIAEVLDALPASPMSDSEPEGTGQ